MTDKELLVELARLIHERRADGEPMTDVRVGRPEWEAMGRPDLLAGARIRPQAKPMTRWPG